MNQLKPALSDFLNNIYIVLTYTSRPANIGSAARAMKTIGLSDLVLAVLNLMPTPMTAVPSVFDPRNPQNLKLLEESFTLAFGVADVLHNVRITAMLDDAPADTITSHALTNRRREITAPLQTPRKLVSELLQAARRGEKVVLVFGNEIFGSGIEEVQACNRLMTINGNPDYFPLDLTQAVQVVCYEIFSQTDMLMAYLQREDHATTHEQIKGIVVHMESAMDDIGFFNRRNSEHLMCRMQGLLGRVNTQTEDTDIPRGLFNTVNHRVSKKDQLKAV